MLRASRRSARLRAEERSGSVAATSPIAKTGRPGTWRSGRPARNRRRRAARRAASRCWADPADRPDHRVGRRRRLAGGPRDRPVGDLVAVEAVRHDGAVAGVQMTPRAASRGRRGPRRGRGAGAARARRGSRGRPACRASGGDVGRGAHRRGAAADHDDRGGGREPLVGGRRSAATSGGRLQSGRRQKPLVTPVEITSTSYGSSGPRRRRATPTVRASRSRPVSVPCTVRARSSRR